ncbi:MAG: hypothetical protein IPL36_14130 [Nigerium sp.]|nr:hypothetical protein [Nigerium sp.]
MVSPVALGFVRLTTGRRALASPLRVEQATGVVTSWLRQSEVRFPPDTRRGRVERPATSLPVS